MNNLLVGSVLKLINDFGQAVTYTRVNKGSYNPATGDTGAGAEPPLTVKAYFANYNLMDVGSLVNGGRTVCIPTVDTSGNSLPEPQADDKFEGVTGDIVVVKETQKVYSGNSVICYICMVKE